MTRPWEVSNATRTWEQPVIYPRIVAITRPTLTATVGLGPYSAVQKSNETPILSGLPASIQIDRTGRPPEAKLPADAIGAPTFRIFIPNGYVSIGQMLVRDIITDDAAIRYQVVAIEWTPFGVQSRAQQLET